MADVHGMHDELIRGGVESLGSWLVNYGKHPYFRPVAHAIWGAMKELAAKDSEEEMAELLARFPSAPWEES